MGVFREAMREAREILHETMSVPAKYFPMEYNPSTSIVIDITVRVHDKFMALGDLKGTNFNYAEIESIAPRAIFWRSEVTPARNFIISLEPGLAYRIDNISEHDDKTVTCAVVRMKVDKTTSFPVPSAPT